MGKAHVYNRADINTDEIIPARYLTLFEESEMGKHCMEDIDPDFVNKVKEGDFIIAGENFGCGSSREHAIWSIRGAGVKVVFASSYARIFMRNAINNGFIVVELKGIADRINDGDELDVNLETGLIKNLTQGTEETFPPIPEFAFEVAKAGGYLNYLKAQG